MRRPRPPASSTRIRSPRVRLERKGAGFAVAGPGIYVWEATPEEVTWARDLAAYASARGERQPR